MAESPVPQSPEIILGEYKPGLVAERVAFARGLGTVTFLENEHGGTDAVLHDVKTEDQESGETWVLPSIVSPISLRSDRAVSAELPRLRRIVTLERSFLRTYGGRLAPIVGIERQRTSA